jgi:DNA-binding LacI/PurR family transcriptional regulator
MSANMHDVAKLAEVSQRTVSNVVNGYPHVRPETRARVEKAIAVLRYRPNVSAQKLRHGRTGMVALAVPEIAAPYFAELANHVQLRAAERGITLLIDQTGGLRERELLVLDGYRSNIIDGLILSPLSVTPADLINRGLDFPIVLLGESIDNGGVIHVSIDNVAAARVATEHLLELGRRRIAAVGAMPGLDSSGPASRRMRGYTEAISAAGLPFSAELNIPTGNWTRASGHAIAADILDRGVDVDAIFCFKRPTGAGRHEGVAATWRSGARRHRDRRLGEHRWWGPGGAAVARPAVSNMSRTGSLQYRCEHHRRRCGIRTRPGSQAGATPEADRR